MDNFLRELELLNDDDRFKGIIEALLFASGDPLSIKELSSILGIGEKQVRRIMDQMIEEYNKDTRGICVIEFNNKFQLSTKPEYGNYVKKLVKPDNRQNLSNAAIETLSIIAYKQPITKAEIDEIRGVRSDRAITTLLEKGLIREAGRKETTGRPILYCTTDEFLKYFGFKNLEELPELIEFNMEFEEE